MAKADALQAFRQISTDVTAAAQVGGGDLAVLGELELTADEERMVIGAAAELCEAADEVTGFEWVDPAGGGHNDAAAETGIPSAPGLTFSRSGDMWAERRYVKQLTTYVGFGKPGL